ncbi:MAG: hypothetical protein ABIP94_06255 [Planctomycetota bacterium]
MRRALLFSSGSVSLLASYLATSHCCERLNVFAAVGLMKPG